jgi:serine/threonine protein kinase
MGKMPDHIISFLFKQLVNGVKAIHEVKVGHNDIKPANIMLTYDGLLSNSTIDTYEDIITKNIRLAVGDLGLSTLYFSKD